MKLCVEFEWRDVGEIQMEGDRLRFPKVSASPGVYRFRLISATGERHYIGETSLLNRRFQHYRTPGPTQLTNLRLNALLKELLPSGGRGEVALVTDAMIDIGGEAFEADLGHSAIRLLIENAALIAAAEAGTAVENLERGRSRQNGSAIGRERRASLGARRRKSA